MATLATASNQKPAFPVRITNQKMKVFVTFVLDFLEKNEDTPIMLHTLPHGFYPPPELKINWTAEPAEAGPSTTAEQQCEPSKSNKPNQKNKPKNPQRDSSNNVTKTIPRLISIIEIIKREFLKNLAAKHSIRLAGLHQYNEIGTVEDLELQMGKESQEGKNTSTNESADVDESFDELFDEREKQVVDALSGKNHIQEKRTPYMKVTLSLNAIPALVEQGASYQPPTIRTVSKSAKGRARKREKKRKAVEAEEWDGIR